MKRTLLILALISLFLGACTKKDSSHDLYNSILHKDKITVGISFNSKPFGFKDSRGNVQGMEADLAREIAERLLGSRDKVVFKNIIPQDRMKAAASGDVDMVISTMTITPQRKKLVYFTIPYFVAGQAICVRKDKKIDSRYDLMNKRIIVILGTTGEKNIQNFIPNVLIEGYEDNLDAINAFKSGYGDAITTDDALLQGLVIDNDNYLILPERLTQEPYGIALKKSKQANTLKNKVNEILDEIKNDGILDALKYKWGLS